jgi:leader peptidase (prepilin peptidase) / N-methyltransferase
MENWILQIIAIILGASIGSFINVVVYRLPAGISLLYPPSRCPQCLTKLAPKDNIPILGWFLLKGKCRYCHKPISWRYPLVEAIAAFLFWAVAAFWGFSIPLQILLAFALFLSWLLALSLIDLDTMTLPNSLTQSGLVIGLIYQGLIYQAFSPLSPLDSKSSPFDSLIGGIVGAVVGIWLLPSLIFLIQVGVLIGDLIHLPVGSLKGKELMGGADSKLSAMIGAWLGWEKLLVAIAVANVIGLLGNLSKIGTGKPVPFGPFLALGGAIALFYGDKIIKNYLGWIGLS